MTIAAREYEGTGKDRRTSVSLVSSGSLFNRRDRGERKESHRLRINHRQRTDMISQDVAAREIHYIRRARRNRQEHATAEAGGCGARGGT